MKLEEGAILLDSVISEVVYYRLLLEKEYSKEKVDNNQKNENVGKYNVFAKMSNKIKENTQNKYNERIDNINKEIDNLLEKNPKLNKDLTEDMLAKDLIDFFKNDKNNFLKELFSILIISDETYKYEFNDEELKKLSLLIYNDEKRLNNSFKEFNQITKAISSRTIEKKDDVIIDALKLIIIRFISEGSLKEISSSKDSKDLSLLVTYGLDSNDLDKDYIMNLYYTMGYDYISLSLGIKTYLLVRAKYEISNIDYSAMLSPIIDVLMDISKKSCKQLLIDNDNIEINKKLMEIIDKVINYLIKEFKL
jgi:hypothetical protein